MEGGSFTLTIGSGDWWVPSYVAVFGIDTTFGQPNVLIPFVHAPTISLERMSADPSEGWHTNALPHALLMPPPVRPPVGPIGPIGGVLEEMARSDGEGNAAGRRRVPVLRMDRHDR